MNGHKNARTTPYDQVGIVRRAMVVRAVRLSRMRDLDPPMPMRRYERAHPQEMIHIDIKKLGRLYRVDQRIMRLHAPAIPKAQPATERSKATPADRVKAPVGSSPTSASTMPHV